MKEETWRTADMSWLDELQHEIKQLQDEKLAQGAVKEFMEGSLNSIIRDLREENQILKDDWSLMRDMLSWMADNQYPSFLMPTKAKETLANLKFEVKE